MTACEGRREENKRRTRAALHEAAIRLVAERGLDEVTTAQIAEAAEVSPRTFFNYFPTKDDALTGADPDRAAAAAEKLRSLPEHLDPWTMLEHTVTDYVINLSQRSELWQLRREVFRRYPHLMSASFGHNREIEEALAEALNPRYDLTQRRLIAALAMRVAGISITQLIAENPAGTANRQAVAKALADNFEFARPSGLPRRDDAPYE
ncbi:hypothetical protein BSZ39_05730 [Bowdeniella nasicola]|uniref:HTH tetR-type domain-containing protein n=1 Tax=Bowdeniella nasicola TaxID=208480 RepID=A0A1Q5Q2U1_9ACTO|nr:TetR family transcriptional regulator [Bowdeniella nasicola]OKL54158.1 hypothetical protein BSZ39_05730 [Bowdeniella nasicola]